MLTMHCDVNQEDSVGHIWSCLNDIGVSRIDHGVNALEDHLLCAEIARRGLALTVCPISNGFVTGGPKADVVKEMLALGMRVTVNSDDPAYFAGYIEENYTLVHEAAGIDGRGLAQLSRNAFECAWLPRTIKDGYLALVDEQVARLEAA